ncbi:MAG: winged helix-turn-helix transcriptional regulator [Flavobacteriales bacterium]|nr:winged helix-turn-helix transcriptional regulator [Flavobacteriales bacterium]
MGLTKTEQFTDEQNRLAKMAKALGHPARIAILQYLSTQESCVCGSIVKTVGLAQATVSQHLKALKDADLIQGNIEGTNTCYCVNTSRIKQVKEQLSQLLNKCCTTSSCC